MATSEDCNNVICNYGGGEGRHTHGRGCAQTHTHPTHTCAMFPPAANTVCFSQGWQQIDAEQTLTNQLLLRGLMCGWSVSKGAPTSSLCSWLLFLPHTNGRKVSSGDAESNDEPPACSRPSSPVPFKVASGPVWAEAELILLHTHTHSVNVMSSQILGLVGVGVCVLVQAFLFRLNLFFPAKTCIWVPLHSPHSTTLTDPRLHSHIISHLWATAVLCSNMSTVCIRVSDAKRLPFVCGTDADAKWTRNRGGSNPPGWPMRHTESSPRPRILTGISHTACGTKGEDISTCGEHSLDSSGSNLGAAFLTLKHNILEKEKIVF